MEALDQDLDEGQLELPSEPMLLNMGPSHPAMHGTVRIQLELSGEAVEDVHAIERELDQHLAEVASCAASTGVTWMATGFHPLARQDELPWVPKDRYAVMREYFPTRGPRGLDMMRRTATVQVNELEPVKVPYPSVQPQTRVIAPSETMNWAVLASQLLELDAVVTLPQPVKIMAKNSIMTVTNRIFWLVIFRRAFMPSLSPSFTPKSN